MNISFQIRKLYCKVTTVYSVLKPSSLYFWNQVARMGLLSEGSPLSWEETKALAEHVRQHGIEQFINLYSKLRDRTGDVLKWGDEVCQLKFCCIYFCV